VLKCITPIPFRDFSTLLIQPLPLLRLFQGTNTTKKRFNPKSKDSAYLLHELELNQSLHYNLNVMETTQEIKIERDSPPKPHRFAGFGRQLFFTLFVGSFIALLAMGGAVFAYEAKYNEKVYPQVIVNDIDLTGLSLGQAIARLNTDLNYPSNGKIVFTFDNQQWIFSPQELGFTNNPTDIAIQAYKTGREGNFLERIFNQFNANTNGVKLYASSTYDAKQAYAKLEAIASQIDRPVIEASISIDGTQINTHDGQIGRMLDIPETLNKLQAYFLIQQDAQIPLVIKEQAPRILHAGETAKQAEAILSAPLTLKHPNEELDLEPWVIQPETLATLLSIEHDPDNAQNGFKLSLNSQAIERYLTSIAPKFVVQPENARMRFNPETRELELLQNAVMGKALDIDNSLSMILEGIRNDEHEFTLLLKDVIPAVHDNVTAAELGITELIVEKSTYFYGSEPARIQNILAGSSTFNGILIAPGEVFSMAKYMDNISLDNGYAEAIIIVGDQSVKGIGGGICQVSTTLFRAAFFGGFPIVERHAHAYRVRYYEQQSNGWADNNLAGLDASIYIPVADLKFTNDSDYWILMETEMSGASLTWRFYSTSDGRTVDWNSTGITNVEEPPEDVYREDPTLPPGTIKQVDWAVNGATVSVYRTVYKNGEVWFNDAVHTKYIAWPNGFNYGPGTEIP